MSDRRIGNLFGYPVYKTESGYSFGCGAVKLTQSQVNNFLEELEIRTEKKPLARIRDFNYINRILTGRDIDADKSVSTIFKFFKYEKKRPIAKVVKAVKPPVKKAVKKKAAKKK